MTTIEDGGDSRSQTIAAVERAADVLIHFAQSPRSSLGVTDLASELGISKAVVHRILMSLRSRGLIESDADTRRYRIGPMALRLGLSALNRVSVRSEVLPELRRLCTATGETATFSLRTGNSRVYVDQVTPAREVIMSVSIGVPYPLHAGASSKAFLAFLPDHEIEAYLSNPLASLTEGTVTDVERLRAELAEIRERGWALSSQERQRGASAVAAPIFNHEGTVAGVVSVGGPADRFLAEVDDCTREVLRAAGAVSRRLGSTEMVSQS